MTDETPEPPGICGCGCGNPTPLARRTRTNRGWVAGQPHRYLPGHWSTNGRPECDPTDLADCPECGKPMHVRSRADGVSQARCREGHYCNAGGRCKPCAVAKPRPPKPAKAAAYPEGARINTMIHDGLNAARLLQEWEHFGELLGWTPSRFADAMGHSEEGVRRVIAGWAAQHPGDPRPASYAAAREREAEAKRRAAAVPF